MFFEADMFHRRQQLLRRVTAARRHRAATGWGIFPATDPWGDRLRLDGSARNAPAERPDLLTEGGAFVLNAALLKPRTIGQRVVAALPDPVGTLSAAAGAVALAVTGVIRSPLARMLTVARSAWRHGAAGARGSVAGAVRRVRQDLALGSNAAGRLARDGAASLANVLPGFARPPSLVPAYARARQGDRPAAR